MEEAPLYGRSCPGPQVRDDGDAFVIVAVKAHGRRQGAVTDEPHLSRHLRADYKNGRSPLR